MSRVNINASRAIAYLRNIGADISTHDAETWERKEKETRAARRMHKRELKKSCGHFRTYDCKVHSDEGSEIIAYCHDCRKAVSSRPLTSPRGPNGGGEPLPVERIA